MKYDQGALDAVLKYAHVAAPEDPETFVATALIESGLRPQAEGDGGNSFGIFQLNRKGRLASYGLTKQQAFNPETNARVSADEFRKFYDQGARGSELALRAQRPSDPNYGNKFNNALAEARRLLGRRSGGKGQGGSGPAPGVGFPDATTATVPVQSAPATLSPQSAALLAEYLDSSRGAVLRGEQPSGVFDLVPQLKLNPLPVQEIDVPGVPETQVFDDFTIDQNSQNIRSKGGRLSNVDAKLIGSPYQGTHSLGNWQSDNAIDLDYPVGTPLFAADDGVIGNNIGSLGSDGGRFNGFRVQINSKDNAYWYGHLQSLAPGIKAGTRVRKGQLIGYSGTANGVPHLHIGIKNGDPRQILSY